MLFRSTASPRPSTRWASSANAGRSRASDRAAAASDVGAITRPQAASFLSTEAGWVAGTDTIYPTSDTSKPKSQERIVATTDGGRTWHVQYAGPWTSG